MTVPRDALSTGLPGLDQVLQAVEPGDNIVWQTDSIEEYARFVEPFATHALRSKRRLIYFRFARHLPLVPEGGGAEIHRLSPALGFETFTAEIHKVIESAGVGVFYVFDCLSDLVADWYSDLMLANFFRVTCPFLYDLQTVTYFALFRERHSSDTVAAIRDTTQVLLDVFRHDRRLYVHPLKVDRRHSATMYLPHVWADGAFRPVTESAVLAAVLRHATAQVDSTSRRLDAWEHKFTQARALLEAVASGGRPAADAQDTFTRLLRMMVTRDERLMLLASRYLDLSDVLAIKQRMIGTGLVGGKSAGMLLARAILCKTDRRWHETLEPHDSFYVGSDVFYTYLVRNDCWRIRRNQRNPASFLDGADEARERILNGTFPPAIVERCVVMLEYFGQSPIIVRSSSLLEDSFGNAFTGKYDSVFCPNQGAPSERLAALLSAVQSVYASTMSAEALLYRAHRGLLDSDEQMAILVQRVSGALYGHLFYPQVAGVALSYNPYVWSEYIDPHAGMLRLVFGLGTRAVNRSDDDYTRVIALNAPERRPETSSDEVTEYAQHRVDVLDLQANEFRSLPSNEVFRLSPGLPLEPFVSPRVLTESRTMDTHGPRSVHWVLTFDGLLSASSFVEDMREMLRALHATYQYPVDVEFTANFLADGALRISLVQCRPLQVKEGGTLAPAPDAIAPEDLVLEARGAIVGQSSVCAVDRIIYVVPRAYRELSVRDRHSIARLIGRLTHGPARRAGQTVMLLGPGRWGSSTPSLGVPVSFAEINTISVLCEIVATRDHLVPDVSLGTHFFNDLVEANMLYLAVFPGRGGNSLNEAFFEQQHNLLGTLLPDAEAWSHVVRVIDPAEVLDGRALYLHADCLAQRALCYVAAA